jgi:serine/threonine protein kinase
VQRSIRVHGSAGGQTGASQLDLAAQILRPPSLPGLVVHRSYAEPHNVNGPGLQLSLGAVLYELVTSRRPFSGSSEADIFDAVLNRTPVEPLRLNRAIPPALDAVVTKALEKDRELRYQSASDARADLKRLPRETDTARATKHVAFSEPHPCNAWMLERNRHGDGPPGVARRSPTRHTSDLPQDCPAPRQRVQSPAISVLVLASSPW